MPKWTTNDMPDQTGRIVLVTGANSGLGLYTAQIFAGKGAQVIMACRNPKKAEDAYQQVMAYAPGAKVEVLALDLGDLASVNSPSISLAAQPGFVLTDLQARASRETGSGLEDFIYQRITRLVSQPVEMGALSEAP